MDDSAGEVARAEAVCERLRGVLGENLVSFVLYGSAARNESAPGASDVNVVIVLRRSTPEAHHAIGSELRTFPGVTPFVLSRWELPRSRPVFALKFRSIARNHRVLYGEDVLSDFAPSDDIVRFLCEQSLRNLRLRLEHAYIGNVQTPERYGSALAKSVPSLIVALSELLRTAGEGVPIPHAARPAAIGRFLDCDSTILGELRQLRAKPRALTADEAFAYHSRVFALLSRALDWVREQWPIPTATT